MIDSFRDKYYFLSNFYMCQFYYNGLVFHNSEAAFQAQKDLTRSREFCFLPANKAKALGRKVSLRSDWEDVKLDIMYDIIKSKFTQNADIRQLLLDTKDEELIEGNNWNDTYWGICRGKGQNNLGKLLMKLRKELQERGN